VILKSGKNISFASAYHPLMIGFMLNIVLPARIGEIARPLVLKKIESVPFSTGLGSVAAERLFDICILVLFFIVLFYSVEIDPHLNIKFGKYHLNKSLLMSIGNGMIQIGLAIICIMLLLASNAFRDKARLFIMGIPGLLFRKNQSLKNKLEQKVSKPVVIAMENLGMGFSIIKNPMDIFICIILSIGIWIFAGVSYYMLLLGFQGLTLTFVEIFLFMIIICFFIALPSAPGYWGLWEAGGVFALTLFGVASSEAVSFTLANHVIQFVPVIVAGIISMMLAGVNFKQFISFEKMTDETEHNK
jgi:uncharacterized protein (TIRG00374 family)